MNDKNYIEQVTNLEREKKYYVPIELLKEALNKIQDITDEEDLVENSDSEIAEYLDEIRSKAYSQKKELFVIDNKDDKKDISTCPYCGGEMLLEFSKENERSYYNRGYRIRGEQVVYKCAYCGATSPKVPVRIMHLNEDAVREEIERQIEYAVEEIKNEEEDNYDD